MGSALLNSKSDPRDTDEELALNDEYSEKLIGLDDPLLYYCRLCEVFVACKENLGF